MIKKILNNQDFIEGYKEQVLSIEIISDNHDFDAIEEEWNSLVEQADAYIFQTWQWQRTWWKYFGGKNRLHILLFRDNERLVGIAPLFLDYFKMIGVPVYKCLRFLGSRVMQPVGGSFPVELAFSDYLSIIAHPDYVKNILYDFQKYLPSQSTLYDEIIFEEIPDNNVFFDLLISLPKKNKWKYIISKASVCPYIMLPGSWDEFLEPLSSNARYQIRRLIRLVTKDKIFELRTAQTEDEIIRAFDLLVDYHQRRWHNLNQPGIFADKRIHDFFKEVTLYFHKNGWLMFKMLYVQEHCVAVDLLFLFKGTVYMMQRGFDDRSPYAKYGLGNILLYCVIKEAIEKSLKAYDFLRGDENYKLRTATHGNQNKELIIQIWKKRRPFASPLNEIVRNYSHLKRKLRIEKLVFDVHFHRQNFFPALSRYFSYTLQRIGKRLVND